MSTTTSVTVWCDVDDCYEWNQGGEGNGVAQARWEARQAGWGRRRNRDLCPDHAAEADRHPSS